MGRRGVGLQQGRERCMMARRWSDLLVVRWRSSCYAPQVWSVCGEMNDSGTVNNVYAPQVKAPVCRLHDKLNVLCRSMKRCCFQEENRTHLVALIGFFAAILGRCFCIGVVFRHCVVIALQDKWLGRWSDRWKEVVVWCLRRLAEGKAV